MHTNSHGPRTPKQTCERLFHWAWAGLAVLLLVACGGGGGGGGGDGDGGGGDGGGGAGIETQAPPPIDNTRPPPSVLSQSVTLSGQVTFDYVPSVSGKLDYPNTVAKPVRGAALEIVLSDRVLRTVTDNQGRYSVEVPRNQIVRLRVLAQLDANGAAVTVTDNTNGDALYAVESPDFLSSSRTVNLHAASGWTGSSYGDPRSAAPFAILDTIYRAHNKVLDVDPNAKFRPLTLHWSVNNQPATGNLAYGNIGTSFFRNSTTQGDIYILGAENVDTDEYDESVIAHEWGHHYQRTFSRDDSMGGSHSGSEFLDMTIAFSEGWGQAIAGIVNERADVNDSLGTGQAEGFIVALAGDSPTDPGWFREVSVAQIIYQLNQTLGFGPIHAAMQTLATSPAFTSIHAFSHAVRQFSDTAGDALDPLLAAQSIVTSRLSEDAFGFGETNDAGLAAQTFLRLALPLPIYLPLKMAEPAVACIHNAFRTLNKLGNHRLMRFNADKAGWYRLSVDGESLGYSNYDGTLSRPFISILIRDERTWYSSNSSTLKGDWYLPAGTTVLSVTDRAINKEESALGCLQVTISNSTAP